jgi:hypothetical protein
MTARGRLGPDEQADLKAAGDPLCPIAQGSRVGRPEPLGILPQESDDREKYSGRISLPK